MVIHSILNQIITRSEQLIAIYQRLNDVELDKHVLECIHEKLIDKAEFMLESRVELNTWELINNANTMFFRQNGSRLRNSRVLAIETHQKRQIALIWFEIIIK